MVCPTLRPSNRDYSARHTLSIIHPDTEHTQWATVRAPSFTFIALPKYSSGEFTPFRRKLLQVQRSLKNKKNRISLRTSGIFTSFPLCLVFPFSFSPADSRWVWEFAPRRGSTPTPPVHTLVAEWQDCCLSAAITSAMLGAWHVCTNARGVITSKYTVRKVV